ncbi:hypothetical protein D4765_14120 [Subtercola vilae]|uniref:Uncharacterized protein n=1 Tax=Subtercola vilae TaxID=2056433 RepID=A0A4T2BQ56_9MICO|nr:hypothetical protein D4765_14120 [Subtercola vilae]
MSVDADEIHTYRVVADGFDDVMAHPGHRAAVPLNVAAILRRLPPDPCRIACSIRLHLEYPVRAAAKSLCEAASPFAGCGTWVV